MKIFNQEQISTVSFAVLLLGLLLKMQESCHCPTTATTCMQKSTQTDRIQLRIQTHKQVQVSIHAIYFYIHHYAHLHKDVRA